MLEQNSLQNFEQPMTRSPKNSLFDSLKPKTAFLIGFFGGILALCTIGFFILLGLTLASGQSGTVAKNTNNSNNSANLNQPTAQQYSPPPAVTNDDHKQGNAQAKVVMIEYSDFQCPFCKQHHETLKKILNDYQGQVLWVFRHFPLTSIHPQANKAALASECASEQGKFWEYADKLFANQSSLSDDYYSQLAGELNLKIDQFNNCLNSSKYQSKVTEQSQDGQQAGAKGTPATFVNNQLVSGAVPYDQFKTAIDNALK